MKYFVRYQNGDLIETESIFGYIVLGNGFSFSSCLSVMVAASVIFAIILILGVLFIALCNAIV
jgi:hypothetical protein